MNGDIGNFYKKTTKKLFQTNNKTAKARVRNKFHYSKILAVYKHKGRMTLYKFPSKL